MSLLAYRRVTKTGAAGKWRLRWLLQQLTQVSCLAAPLDQVHAGCVADRYSTQLASHLLLVGCLLLWLWTSGKVTRIQTWFGPVSAQ